MSGPSPIHVAVAGAGAFGRNHLRVYRQLERSGVPVAVTAIVETSPETARLLGHEYGVRAFASLAEALAERSMGRLPLDALSVCVPTAAHHPVALAALEAGLDVLVEKPIAATLAEAESLIAAARRYGRLLQVGHLERFNPAVTAAAARLHHPMFFEAHRLSIFTPRALDVDVVLDLMIHDLDVVLRFARSPVREVRAVGLPVLSGKVDIANVRIEFESGCVANFTASRVSTEKIRKLRFFQPHQYVSIDYARQDLLIINAPDARALAVRAPADAAPQTPPAGLSPAGLAMEKPEISPGEPLSLELAAFVHAVATRTPAPVSGEDGAAALDLALQVNDAIREHSHRAGLHRLR